jgi:hypothetical protein
MALDCNGIEVGSLNLLYKFETSSRLHIVSCYFHILIFHYSTIFSVNPSTQGRRVRVCRLCPAQRRFIEGAPWIKHSVCYVKFHYKAENDLRYSLSPTLCLLLSILRYSEIYKYLSSDNNSNSVNRKSGSRNYGLV